MLSRDCTILYYNMIVISVTLIEEHYLKSQEMTQEPEIVTEEDQKSEDSKQPSPGQYFSIVCTGQRQSDCVTVKMALSSDHLVSFDIKFSRQGLKMLVAREALPSDTCVLEAESCKHVQCINPP